MSSDELIVLIEENVQDYALIVTDTGGRIINCRGAEHIFGYLAAEVLGEDAALIFTPEDRQREIPEKEFETAAMKGRASDERRHIRKDGSTFWASGSLTALREPNGSLRGTVKIVRDLSDRKQLEDALRAETEMARRERDRAEAAAREIAQLNELLRRAMAEAHHRIKNSFQMLSSLVDMQQGSRESDDVVDHSKLSMHIRSLSAIHDLLTEEVKTADEFDFVSGKSLLDKLVSLLRNTLAGRTLRARVDEITLPLKQATALAPLVSEMVANAAKHGRGDIWVTLARAGNAVRLEVRDQGPGFPDDFDPAGAAHTGLELIGTLVRYDLQGDISYDNAADGGALVAVTFPASPLRRREPAGHMRPFPRL